MAEREGVGGLGGHRQLWTGIDSSRESRLGERTYNSFVIRRTKNIKLYNDLLRQLVFVIFTQAIVQWFLEYVEALLPTPVVCHVINIGNKYR